MILYIANRAEIARRIIRTAKKMGIKTCVGYATVDKDLPFVREADRAIEISCEEPKQAYLDFQKVIQSAKSLGATHLHPGYGFVSENPDFVEAVQAAGLIFVGPNAESMRQVGDKIGSRHFLKKLNVPLLPSFDEEDQSEERLSEAAQTLGFPLLIKPSAGGGGKGMLRVNSSAEFLENLRSSKRISQSAFGDDRVFLERLVDPARHIEVQILADQNGEVKILGERECSLQRRHQKLIEETPCIYFSEALRKKIYHYSKLIAEAVKYQSAGTLEWIWDGQEGIYFLEMNTRLQVEHPVTELVWGLDLVEWQLRIADVQSVSELNPQARGHAMEARLCAEDPAQNFMPSGGKIHQLCLPEEIRVDFGFYEKNEISPYFDSLLGKFIAFANNRDEVILKLSEALEKTALLGPMTNRAYLIQILKNENVQKGELSTQLLSRMPYIFDAKAAVEAIQEIKNSSPEVVDETEEDLDFYSPWGKVKRTGTDSWWEDYGAKRYFHLPFADWSMPRPRREQKAGEDTESSEQETQIISPMPSKIIQLKVEEGQEVKKGDVLLVLEAMKMEHQIKASFPARVKSLRVKVGDQVPPEEVLLELEALE